LPALIINYRPCSVNSLALSSLIVTPSASNSAILSANCGKYFLCAINNSSNTRFAVAPEGTCGLSVNACYAKP
jgi:hypothetical protein